MKEGLPEPLYAALRRIWRFFGGTSMVSRDPRAVIWFRRVVLRRKPVLRHFDIHLVDHCNLNCKGCTHFSGLFEPTFADRAEFERDMRSMAGLFSHVRQIYLMGGEPLLHPEAPAFVRLAREVFPRTRLYLLTNGVLVTRMAQEIWDSLAETGTTLMVSPYPVGLPMAEIESLAALNGVQVDVTTPREEFHKIPIDLAGGHDAAASFAGCREFNNCPIVRNGRLYPCSYTALADVFREYFGIDGLEVSDQDWIELGPSTDPEEAMRFLRQPVPWCTNCDLAARSYAPWARSSNSIGEWVKEPS